MRFLIIFTSVIHKLILFLINISSNQLESYKITSKGYVEGLL